MVEQHLLTGLVDDALTSNRPKLLRKLVVPQREWFDDVSVTIDHRKSAGHRHEVAP